MNTVCCIVAAFLRSKTFYSTSTFIPSVVDGTLGIATDKFQVVAALCPKHSWVTLLVCHKTLQVFISLKPTRPCSVS